MDYLVVIFLGLSIGSFLNVCIYRIPNEESISYPPSHCTNCSYKLKWYDLIPVLSYILLKGKCRGCSEKISLQYPMVEILNAIVYLLIYMQYGVSEYTIKYMLLTSLMIVIGMIDFKTKFVFTATTAFGVAISSIFIVYTWIESGNFPLDYIIGGLIGFLVIALIVILTRGMGEGDIEIAVVCGLFLGAKATIFMIFLSFILGGIVATFYLVKKLKGKKEEMAFGPYLAIATIVSMFVGNQIINAYLNAYLNYV